MTKSQLLLLRKKKLKRRRKRRKRLKIKNLRKRNLIAQTIPQLMIRTPHILKYLLLQ